MDNEKDVEVLLKMPFWERFTDEEYTAMSNAIEALENNDKLAEDLQNCLEMYKKKKAEVKALKQKGRWLDDVSGYTCVCSVCGIKQEIRARFLFSYCPICGTPMER